MTRPDPTPASLRGVARSLAAEARACQDPAERRIITWEAHQWARQAAGWRASEKRNAVTGH